MLYLEPIMKTVQLHRSLQRFGLCGPARSYCMDCENCTVHNSVANTDTNPTEWSWSYHDR